MNTKLLMMASSIFMAILGLTLIFISDQLIKFLELSANAWLSILVQITGAVYFGFAMINWMARNVLIGGIFSRPLAIGNFAHFFIAGMALLRASSKNELDTIYLYIFTGFYLLFAISFGSVLFRPPK